MIRPDAATLAAFVGALFRYADANTRVSWRSFRDDTKDAKPVFIESSHFTGDLDALGEAALHYATQAADFPHPAVFCPPIATLNHATKAREQDLANGLALSVECDADPTHARETLERILGPATVVVESGGVTAGGEAKLHLHWRLAEPTSDVSEHAKLKRARILATAIAGGDATNVPVVHPIRWPGSVHRKGEPRLARIVALEVDREIVLSDAIEQLEASAPLVASTTAKQIIKGDNATLIAELVATLMSGQAMHDPLIRLAMCYLGGGMHDAHAVITLRGLMGAIPAGARGSEARWQGHYNDVPRTVGSAREKLGPRGSAPPPARCRSSPSRRRSRSARSCVRGAT
jgi:hypothetical protein